MDAEEEPKFYELAPWQRMQYKVDPPSHFLWVVCGGCRLR
jgi:hypothetical protein